MTNIRKALETLVNAKALAGVRAIVAGWNGENKPQGERYRRHPDKLGATLPKTTCGAVYELDDAMQAARAALAAPASGGEADDGDFWDRIKDDDQLSGARKKLSMHELRLLFQHARDAIAHSPKPEGVVRRLNASAVPHSSIVGDGLTLNHMDGRAGFIVNFIGASEGITAEETRALTAQFQWFANRYGVSVPSRQVKP